MSWRCLDNRAPEAASPALLKAVTSLRKILERADDPLLRLFMRREVAKKYATVKRIIESQPDAS